MIEIGDTYKHCDYKFLVKITEIDLLHGTVKMIVTKTFDNGLIVTGEKLTYPLERFNKYYEKCN